MDQLWRNDVLDISTLTAEWYSEYGVNETITSLKSGVGNVLK